MTRSKAKRKPHYIPSCTYAEKLKRKLEKKQNQSFPRARILPYSGVSYYTNGKRSSCAFKGYFNVIHYNRNGAIAEYLYDFNLRNELDKALEKSS